MIPTWARQNDPQVPPTVIGMIDPDSGVPVTQQLTDILRGQIQRGELAPGQRLRTEPECMHEYGLGRNTVRQAIAALRAEGLVVTTRQGSRVRTRQSVDDVKVQSHTRITTRMPTKLERRALGIAEGVPVFVVERADGVDPEVLPGDRTALVVE